jgi:hypothetical protein
MHLRLDFTHQQRIRKLNVESDSKVLIDMMTKKNNFNGNVPTIVELMNSCVSHLASNFVVSYF